MQDGRPNCKAFFSSFDQYLTPNPMIRARRLSEASYAHNSRLTATPNLAAHERPTCFSLPAAAPKLF
jgi:hypothetical protein